jgi:G3E family GTPase
MTVRPRLDLTVVTGFLGSGKTTLLRRALGSERGTATALIVNEFGETGLDQDLLAGLGHACVLISGGCACCDRLEDLLAALRRLLDDHERGVLGGLRQVVIETSGLADPAPIAMSIATDPVLKHHFDLGAIVAVVDGLTGAQQLDLHPEVRRQIEMADRIVISKTDLAAADDISELERVLERLNPAASIEPVEAASRSLFVHGTRRLGTYGRDKRDQAAGHAHTQSVACLCLTFEQPLDWVAFGVWLSLLLHAHGQELLRVKGIIEAAGVGAVAINAVQHLIYPPEHLGNYQDVQQARLVFITRELETQSIARSLRAFQRAA